MKTILILVLTFCTYYGSAQTCASYNSSTLGGEDITPTNTAQHLTGGHLYNGGATFSCAYASLGNQYCATTASAVPYGGVSENGTLTTWPVGFHVSNVAFGNGTGYSNGGSASATGNAAAAVVWCVSTGCEVSISVNPVSFPSGAVWTHTHSFNAPCIAEPDPTYRACSGGAGFVCSNGSDGGSASPTCSDGQWTCNGANECQLPPSQYTCGEGEYGTPSCGSSGWYCYQADSPIIIDTTGTGFHLTNFEDGVRFDITGDGRVQKISWIAAGSTNGWLALPHDGKVTTGKELFGNFTPQPPSDHPNGFLALAVYDLPEKGGNGDGVIDWHDAVWPKLRIWIDKNHDGVAQPDQLFTLPSLGVNSLALTYLESKYTDKFGNQFRYKGSANPDGAPSTDHVDKTMYDVFLLSSATKAKTKPQVAKTDLAADHQLR